MTLNRSGEYLVVLVRELCKLARESEWVEFKVNSYQPDEIGEYVSALANSAAVVGKPCGYVIWGISDRDHRVFALGSSHALRRLATRSLRAGYSVCWNRGFTSSFLKCQLTDILS